MLYRFAALWGVKLMSSKGTDCLYGTGVVSAKNVCNYLNYYKQYYVVTN